MYKPDPRKTAFYNSRAWRRLSRLIRINCLYVCQVCGNKGAEVHHIQELDANKLNDDKYLHDYALNASNLTLLCVSCHNAQRAKLTADDVCITPDGDIKLK